MSRRRRRGDATDSLDMLLDALCNMFGGIIFIALLVAVMSGEQADQRAEAAAPPVPRSLESLTLQNLYDTIAAQVNDLQRENPAAWTQLEQRLSENDETLSTIDRLNDLVAKIEDRTPPVEIAIQQAIRALERLEQLEQTLEDAKDNPDLAAITEAIEQEEQAIVNLKQQLQAAARRRTVNARLSLERKTRLRRLFVILARDRAWVVMADGRDPETQDVSVQLNFDGRGCDQYTPRSSRGFPITATVGNHPRFLELVQTYPRHEFYVFMIVSPDAHGGFALLKAALLRQQYRHNVHLADELTPTLILCPGSPTFSTQ